MTETHDSKKSWKNGTPRMLVTGAGPMRAAAFAMWRELGIHVVLADGHSPDRYEDLVNEFVPLDVRDGSAESDELREVGAGCDAVTTLADDSQITAALLADQLGLPGVGVRAAKIARSKTLQRALFARAGMYVPTWREVRLPDDLDEFFSEGDRPAVIKPSDCAGGMAALKVSSCQEAKRHWPIIKSLSPTHTGIIEDFLEGREVCVDAVVWRRQLQFSSVADVEHLQGLGFLAIAASYATEQPDRTPASREIESVIAALGLDAGIIHAEFKIDNKDRWTLIELGLRPGGGYVPELTTRVTGYDLYEAQARLALGDDPATTSTSAVKWPYAGVRYLVASGSVRRFVPPAMILKRFEDVRVINQEVFAGQQVRVPLSEGGRAGYALGWGRNRAKLDTELDGAIRMLSCELGLTAEFG